VDISSSKYLNVPTEPTKMATPTSPIADDCQGMNFFDIDQELQTLLKLYLPEDLRKHMEPHYRHLGELAGGQLDELARTANRHIPVLHPRNRKGEDEDSIEYHPAYRAMEQIGYGDFGIAAMTNRPGVLGWQDCVPPVVKYVFQYLFAQAEFGLLCPISATDTISRLINRFGDDALKNRCLSRMWSQDMKNIYKGAIFVSEKVGGNDISNLALEARDEDGTWRLYGDKFFCSCVDAEITLVMGRPVGAPAGNKGLALFIVPRTLDDGTRNKYKIVRLKDKMGTRSMPTGEITYEGALAYPLGDVGAKPNKGVSMVMHQISLSRLSHGVRAAGMMRRCLNEALSAAKGRVVFGERIIEKPLLRTQLLGILLPTEQALSMYMFVASQLAAAQNGDEKAEKLVRILTPLIKYQASRDNIDVAVTAMEVRGGIGLMSDYVNSRLVNDAVVGVLWEGTSNINALDVVDRAVSRTRSHEELSSYLLGAIVKLKELPAEFRSRLSSLVESTIAFAEEVAEAKDDTLARQVAEALYHITTAVLLACEGVAAAKINGDARRVVMSKAVVESRLAPHHLLKKRNKVLDKTSTDLLLYDAPVSFEESLRVLAL
jgi:acyl-CoA dehydrogenase